MEQSKIDEILRQYDEKTGSLRLFADRTRLLIEEILLANKLVAHSISCRVKERDSLAKKFARPGKSYGSLDDITDIVGIRVITYFADDVDSVAKLIEQEFEIDRTNSVDKRSLIHPDRFGYLSLHYVLGLSANRRNMAEYKRLPNIKAEVQVRSILQHAWAEIEHDLGYKTSLEVPAKIRRRFSRLAGLLELADEEFKTIRQELARYEEDVLARIKQEPAEIEINKVSLGIFFNGNEHVKAIDEQIMACVGAKVRYEHSDAILGRDVEVLGAFGARTIQQLESALTTNSDVVVSFAEHWMEDDKYDGLVAGISVFYLLYVLTAQTGKTSEVEMFLNLENIEESENRPDIARRVLDVYKSVSEKKGKA